MAGWQGLVLPSSLFLPSAIEYIYICIVIYNYDFVETSGVK